MMNTQPKRYKRRQRAHSGPMIEMAAMIDVVFLLLIFFLAVIRPEDVLTHLDVSRPSPGGGENIPMIRINVLADGLTMNGKRVDLSQMDRFLTKLGQISTTQSVIITCASDSPHSKLVKVLDLCAKAGLSNLALTSR